MKRYLLFAGANYYPSGGWGDFVESFDTIEEAEAYNWRSATPWGNDWYHIVDTQAMQKVAGND